MPRMLTQVHSSFIYWYIYPRNSGYDTVNLLEIIFICSCNCVFSLLFLLSIMSILTSLCFSKSLSLLLLFHLLFFFGDYESSFISWASTNSCFLKFSLTQTKSKGKAFHSLGSARFKLSDSSVLVMTEISIW